MLAECFRFFSHSFIQFPGPGANAEEAYAQQIEAGRSAKMCLLAALKADPKAGPLWVNLANAYQMVGDYKKAKKCLEQVVICLPQSSLSTPGYA